MKIARVSIICLVFIMVTIAVFPAYALTSQEREDLYQAAVLELEAYLDSFGNSSEKLTGIISTFKDLGGYSQSLNLGYYASVLAKIADEQYDFIMKTYLDMLESDTDFNAYLLDALKGSSIGTADKLKAYAQAREFQHNGEKTTAAEYYKQCGSFFDAKIRYFDVIEEIFQEQYDHAFSLLNEGNYAGAYFAFSSISSYNDSAAIMASIVNQLGYTPESITDTLMPVNNLMSIDIDEFLIQLVWESSAHATNYEVYYKNHNDPNWVKYATVPQGDTEIIVSFLDDHDLNMFEYRNYDFKIVSTNGKIRSNDSDIIIGEDNLIEYTYDSFTYLIQNNTVKITHYNGNAANVYIPDTIDGLKVSSIGRMSFDSCESVKSIIIPDTVISIDCYAFCDCRHLTSITIPDSVRYIGSNPFLSCYELTKINISSNHPTLRMIDNVMIYKPENRLVCHLIETNNRSSYTIPNNVTTIGSRAFENCNISNITIPESVTSIGCLAFLWCNISNITIPESVTAIGVGAFFSCDNLSEITIPNSITSIEASTFISCKNLKTITIPNNLTSIGHSAFEDCRKLTTLTIPYSVIYIGEDAFAHCPQLIVNVYRDSYGERYCKENNIRYKVIGE